MSSLAAARADNFYYPPHFDPKKHKNLAGLTGQHPLRERAARLDEGILVIRFEVPFNIWCAKCGEMIAKGERFNADKKAVGNYLSTKIWSFSMRHHCGSNIVIHTDPKNAEYVIMEGARKKVEEYTSEAAGVIELADAKEKAALDDPFFRLEHGVEVKKRVVSATTLLAELADGQDLRHHNPYAMNKEMRAQMRSRKRADETLDAQRDALGLSRGVKLLPTAQSDADNAALAFYKNDQAAHRKAKTHRQAIMAQSIFAKAVSGTESGSLAGVARAQLLPHTHASGVSHDGKGSGKAGTEARLLAGAQLVVADARPGRPVTESDLRPRNPHAQQQLGRQADVQQRQQHVQQQQQQAQQRQQLGGAGDQLPALGFMSSSAPIQESSKAAGHGSSCAVPPISTSSNSKPRVTISLPHSLPSKRKLGEAPSSSFVSPTTSGMPRNTDGVSKPVGLVGSKRSVMDKAALMAKRQRMDPGIKLGLTQPLM